MYYKKQKIRISLFFKFFIFTLLIWISQYSNNYTCRFLKDKNNFERAINLIYKRTLSEYELIESDEKNLNISDKTNPSDREEESYHNNLNSDYINLINLDNDSEVKLDMRNIKENKKINEHNGGHPIIKLIILSGMFICYIFVVLSCLYKNYYIHNTPNGITQDLFSLLTVTLLLLCSIIIVDRGIL
ncbi:Plasmodium exported protein, unknown function [Plasmodium gallinaceum]|uniref:Fam-h protein n=1 Tax=Plasmodium gallinaceum TaxID=5849 RepID=A0A1J1GWH5_PLAGA|nr:Plasmodium exported protein, unknown function [Plasmodium gallinaceum]CRG96907.1 Plasmodium exported protein, unknown function [Plasmodium gallinaceum]